MYGVRRVGRLDGRPAQRPRVTETKTHNPNIGARPNNTLQVT